VVVTSTALDFRPLPGRSSADPFAGLDSPGMSMRVVHLPAGVERKPHRHPSSSEAIYVIEGRGHFWEDGRAHRVRAGDCILVEAGTAHATVPDADSPMKIVCFLPHSELSSNIEELDEMIRIDGEARG
jgi:quercetin dioxygenase-like cupin family protein